MSNPNRGIIELCQDLAAAGERLKKDKEERERYRLELDAWWKSIDDNRKARLAAEAREVDAWQRTEAAMVRSKETPENWSTC